MAGKEDSKTDNFDKELIVKVCVFLFIILNVE